MKPDYVKLYKHFMRRRFFRNFYLSKIRKRTGGEFYSRVLREIFRKYYDLDVGMYTHGGCFIPGSFDRKTKIGRFCSIAVTATAMNRNHPMEYKSMHAFFFNPKVGIVDEDTVEYIPLNIGNDVWIGHNAIIMPHVKEIGNGAVIGAGAVINKDVPPYAVLVGNPARVVRFRFSKELIEQLESSKWWENSIDQIKKDLSNFKGPLEVPTS